DHKRKPERGAGEGHRPRGEPAGPLFRQRPVQDRRPAEQREEGGGRPDADEHQHLERRHRHHEETPSIAPAATAAESDATTTGARNPRLPRYQVAESPVTMASAWSGV